MQSSDALEPELRAFDRAARDPPVPSTKPAGAGCEGPSRLGVGVRVRVRVRVRAEDSSEET